MTQYQFIKTKLEIAEELHKLWDNFPLYKFVKGSQWIRKRELEISECLIDRDTWIEVCRVTWIQKEEEKASPKRGKRLP